MTFIVGICTLHSAKKIVGKRIRVKTGVRKQVDGNYSVVGQFLSFKTLYFVK